MSGGSSSAAGWSSLLESAGPPDDLLRRPDDPRLGEVVEFWKGDPAALRPGRAVLLGFPQDEGVRRNGGRVGAAEAPREIRHWLYRLTPWHPEGDIDLARHPPLDLGNVRITRNLEESQQALGEIVGELLKVGTVPVVLGGGHETAYGHYLGYVKAGRPVGVINIDAHLDVRPLLDGKGHSGSPFRQMLEHPTQPLGSYCCLGVQPGSVSRAHWRYAEEKGTIIESVSRELEHLSAAYYAALHPARGPENLLLTIDADAFAAADVPGVSALNVGGLAGVEGFWFAQVAGGSRPIQSFELVEINPHFDRDGQAARWAARMVWHFLVGLANRQL